MENFDMPQISDIEEFFHGIRNSENMIVDGYFLMTMKDLPAYVGGRDNVESAVQIDIGIDSEVSTPDSKTDRVYYLRYINKVYPAIVNLAFEQVPTSAQRIIFKIARNFDAMIEREGNLILLKNRTRGWKHQILVDHIKHKSDTYQIPGDIFAGFFVFFEATAEILSNKLSNEENVVRYYETFLNKN